MAAHEFDDLNEFLQHRTNDRSGGYLSKWKKKDPPQVDVWLHTRRKPVAVWRHQFPRIVSREKDGETEVHVWSDNLVCHEDEATLKKQNHRNRETGERVHPPSKCPFCKLLEWMRAAVREGDLQLWSPAFEFEAADDDAPTRLSVGGMCGLINDDMTDAEAAECRKHGINKKNAWKENSGAKANYLFLVVDHANPSAGVQKAIESQLLGQKVQGVIMAAQDSLGEEEGNPFKHPYAIRWKHRPNEPVFGDKYQAVRMEKLQLTPEIESLISGDSPDVSKDTRAFNAASLRATMERHCVLPIAPPWDELFEGVEDEPEEDANHPPAETKPKAAPPAPAKSTEPAPAARKRRTSAPAPDAAMASLKKQFDDLDPEADTTVMCAAALPGGKECEQKLPGDYTGACPACGQGGEEPAPPPVKTRGGGGGAAKVQSTPALDEEDNLPFASSVVDPLDPSERWNR